MTVVDATTAGGNGCVACQSFFFLITPQTQTIFDFLRIAPGLGARLNFTFGFHGGVPK